jgi:predicted MFS family arabinose efflux permease
MAVLGPMLVVNMALLTVAGPSFGILASTLLETFDITRGQIGQLNAGYAVVGALVSPFTGRLADRIGGRNLMVTGFGIAALVFVLLGAANGFVLLFVAAALSGVPNGMGNQGTNKYISAEVPVERRGVITGVKQSGVMFGVFCAGLALPRGVAAVGYSATMLTVAGLALLGAAVALVVLPADRGDSSVNRTGGRLPSSMRWIALYSSLMGGAIGCQSAFLALYAEEELGFSRVEAGMLVGSIGLVAVVARIVLGRLTQTVATYAPVLATMALGGMVSFAVIWLASSIGSWLILLTPLVAGFTTSSWNSPVNLASMRLVAPNQAGRSAGMVMFGFMTGYAIAPPLFGAAVDRLGSYDLPWLAGALLCLGAAGTAFAWRRQEHRAAPISVAAGSPSPQPGRVS